MTKYRITQDANGRYHLEQRGFLWLWYSIGESGSLDSVRETAQRMVNQEKPRTFVEDVE